VPPFVLLVLKVLFLALLYFFVYRAIRVGVREVKAAGAPAAAAAAPSGGRRERQARRPKEPSTLVVLGEDGKKRASHRLTGTIQLGRAEACQVRLDDTYVSQFHARLFSRNGGWFIEDLGSTNGTYVNQRRISSPTPVQAGDRLKIGKVQMELRR
jgi:FHA domain-containing protein